MMRGFDIVISLIGIIILAPVMAILWLAVRMDSAGPAIYWSTRVGRYGAPFSMPKFRTMHVDTPNVATDELKSPSRYITRTGKFLRRTSLDELPQFWSVLRGHMAIVGPRPALPSQEGLLAMRKDLGVDVLRPGITGWAQVNGRDELSNEDKARFDAWYLANRSLRTDLMIILSTLGAVASTRGVRH